jgi:hypothetical protein
LATGWGRGSDINRDVEHTAGGAPNEFALRMWIALKMQPAQCAGFGNGEVLLNKLQRLVGVVIQHALPPRFPKYPAVITKLTGRQLDQTIQVQRFNFHLSWNS